MNWILRQLERLRSFNPLAVDGVLAAILLVLGLITVYTQDVRDGMVEPSGWAIATILIVVAPIWVRRRNPLLALERRAASESSCTSAPTGRRARCRCR